MKIETIQTQKGELSHYKTEGGVIDSTSVFLDVLANCPTDTVILDKEDLTDGFFDLKTGIAGEFLQKVSNYQRRLIILGDFQEIQSKSLRDFIYESNKRGQIVFADEIPKAVDLLK